MHFSKTKRASFFHSRLNCEKPLVLWSYVIPLKTFAKTYSALKTFFNRYTLEINKNNPLLFIYHKIEKFPFFY